MRRHKKDHLRILFVCYADGVHAQAWLRLLQGAPFDVRVFATLAHVKSPYAVDSWLFPTYSTIQPWRQHGAQKITWILPGAGTRGRLSQLLEQRLRLSERWLRWIIRTWRPDVIHSLRISIEGVLTWRALRGLPQDQRPVWVVSSWGSDISWSIVLPNWREKVLAVLYDCDGFIADCQSDLEIAMVNGLAPAKVMPGAPVPGTGGFDLQQFRSRRTDIPPSQRKVIVIPKAVETRHLKTYAVLEGLRLAWDAVSDSEIWLLMCAPEVEAWLYNKMPAPLQRACRCRGFIPHNELLDLLFKARIVVAPSLVDGTPNVMLEAMAAGALPLMSPLDSIREWIEDGRNGLLASALYPDQIAAALRRAMTDDRLCEEASQLNWEIIQARANRDIIRPVVLDYYQSLVTSATHGKG